MGESALIKVSARIREVEIAVSQGVESNQLWYFEHVEWGCWVPERREWLRVNTSAE